MKKNNSLSKKILFLCSLCSFAEISVLAENVTPYFGIRSQGVNAARDLVGWQTLINNCGMEDWNGASALTFEYDQSFRPGSICKFLFGNAVSERPALGSPNSCGKIECEDDCTITISGSCVEGRRSTDWLADYFGLPTDFQSSINFSPSIKNFIVDIHSYFGLDQLAEGLYFRIDFPIAYTRWNLNVNETVISEGVNPYTQGYFAANAVGRQNLLTKATDFFTGLTPNLVTGQTIPVTFQPLKFSKWSVNNCDSGRSKTRLSQLAVALGYNILCDADYSFGINLRTEAPTGNKPEGEFLFEPIVGNGHHWTLGVGLNSHAMLWRSTCDDSNFGVYLDANITHLFGTCQTRAFDLCVPGANSRYMIAQKLGPNSQELNGGSTTSESQFINIFTPVANLTTSKVNVSISAQADIAIKFSYVTDRGFNIDLGYNFWGVTCENIDYKKDCNAADLTQWALKGDAYVYGFETTTPVALAATESQATIYTGTNFVGTTAQCPGNTPANAAVITNKNIDNPQLATVTALPTNLDVYSSSTTQNADTQTRTSIPTVPLNIDQINFTGIHSTSNKLFTNISYTWHNSSECWKPFLGVGGSVEFASGESCDQDNCSSGCETACNFDCGDTNGDCVRCGVSQWSVWIKGGVAY